MIEKEQEKRLTISQVEKYWSKLSHTEVELMFYLIYCLRKF
jgi:hypothetical protein